jgi:membrane fusion protein (multidrug efflux system)
VSSDDAQVDGHITAIAPKIAGNVVDVLVNDNQPVKAGQVLVRIDPRDYQARVDMAKAALLQAESQLRSARVVVPWTNETTQSGESGASAQLADAQAELERARLVNEQSSGSDLAYAEANVRTKQASNDRAQADLARMKPLVDKAEISQLQFDAYVAAARVAESELQAAREKLASAGRTPPSARRRGRGSIARQPGPLPGGHLGGQPQAGGHPHRRRRHRRRPPSRRRAPTSRPPNCSSATPPSSRPWMAWSRARASRSARSCSPARDS